MKTLVFALMLTVSFSSPAFAHDAKFHKGPSIEGKIISIQKGRAEVQTENGKVSVLISPETKVETGTSGAAGGIVNLKVGDAVMVSGYKFETDEMAATEIMIHDATGGSHAHAN